MSNNSDSGNTVAFAAAIDCETTGLDPERDQIVELAIVLFAYEPRSLEVRGVVDSYAGLREPSCPISRAAQQTHGLSKQKLLGATLDRARVAGLVERAEFLVAHNVSFDRPFVQALFPEIASKQWHCTLNGLTWSKWGHTRRDLQTLLAAHQIAPGTAHRAEADCRGVIELLGKKSPQKRTYLAELFGLAGECKALEPVAAVLRAFDYPCESGVLLDLRSARPELPPRQLALFVACCHHRMLMEGKTIRGPGFFLWSLKNDWDAVMTADRIQFLEQFLVENKVLPPAVPPIAAPSVLANSERAVSARSGSNGTRPTRRSLAGWLGWWTGRLSRLLFGKRSLPDER